ncbi:hypothetical protein CEQ15_23150 [Chryseobacterium indologenes]|nr:hypothetical protein CEQ15_23150 [Chryseobacterium indologenes]
MSIIYPSLIFSLSSLFFILYSLFFILYSFAHSLQSSILKINLHKNILRQVLSHYGYSFVSSKLQSYGIAILLKLYRL